MRTVILGGGPSGIGVAWGLVKKGHKNITIVEKESQVGGLSGSFTHENLTLDYGPHRFSPEFQDLVSEISVLLGEDWLRVTNTHAVVYRDKVFAYPPKVSNFLNLDSLQQSSKVLTSFVGHRLSNKKVEDSFESSIKNSFGPHLYDTVVKPMCEKVWGDPKTLSKEFAELRFSIPTFVQWGRKLFNDQKSMRDSHFYYPKNGFGELWETLADFLMSKGVEIKFSEYVEDIELTGERITRLRTNRGLIDCEQVISTIPTEAFMKSFRPKDRFPINEPLDMRGMVLVNYVMKRRNILPARVVIFPEEKYFFNRLSEVNQFSPVLVPEPYGVIQADILVDLDSELWNQRDDYFIERVSGDFLYVGFLKESEMVKAFVKRVPIAYPLPTIKREKQQKEINAHFSKIANLYTTGRFATSDYNNSHTALKKGMMLGEFVSEKRTPEEWYVTSESVRHLPIRD